jgi:hypothetical protein
MWWWTKVRKANIAPHIRAMFEVHGETMVTMVLAVRPEERLGDMTIDKHLGDALAWLRERHDVHARKEDRLETVEWAILIFVIVGVLADIAIVAHESSIWP